MDNSGSTSQGLTGLMVYLLGGGTVANIFVAILNYRNNKSIRARTDAESDQIRENTESSRIDTALKSSKALGVLQRELTGLHLTVHKLRGNLTDSEEGNSQLEEEVQLLTRQMGKLKALLASKGIDYDPDDVR